MEAKIQPWEMDALRDRVRGFNRLGLELFLRQDLERSCFVSPLSIAVALSMLLPGAKGATRAEIAGVLRLECNDAELGRSIELLLSSLRSHDADRQIYHEETGTYTFETVEALKLRLANAVFANDGYSILEDAGSLLETHFEAELRTVDFGRAKEAVAQINGWVGEKTCDRIRNLVDAQLISEATRMILVNAVYFLAEWQTPFEESLTSPKPFHPAGGDAVDVDMMRQCLDLRYVEDDRLGVEAVEIPYKAMSMLVLLPRKDAAGGLEALRPSLEDLDRITGGLRSHPVDLQLPRFRIESRFRLSAVLQELGMQEPFEDSADFSGFTREPEGLRVDEVIHQTFITVDENGTEAAAATAILMELGAMEDDEPPKPIPFVVDRPFLFLIRDDVTGCILFMGAMCDPRSSGGDC